MPCCDNVTECITFQSLWILNVTGLRMSLGNQNIADYGTILCLEVYIVPVIVTLGITVSIFTCAVLLRTCLRKKFYSQFLVGICVSSAGFLLSVFISWVYKQGLHVFDVPGLCQMHIFCSHFFAFLTFLLSVISAVMVLCDLTRPKSVSWMNSPGAAKLWVTGLSIFAFTVYSYKSWTHGASKHQSGTDCSVIADSERAMQVLNVIDLFLLLYLPTFSFLVFDIVLLSWFCSAAYTTKDTVYRKRHEEVLKIVLCYSVCFHVFVTPRAVSSSLVVFNRYVHAKEPDSRDLAINQWLQIVFYFFFAINPIFPFCVSRKFRRNAAVLFTNSCSKNGAIQQLRTISPTL